MELRPFASLKEFAGRLRGGPVWCGGDGDMIAVLAENGEIIEISSSARELIGAAGTLVGRSILDFVQREDRADFRAMLGRVSGGDLVDRPADLRVSFRLLRLRRAPALAEAQFRRAAGGRINALIRDRGDEFVRARAARAATQAAPVEQAAAVNDAPASPPADLLADLGHELKTPLNAIMGFAETMREETFGPLGSEKYREYAAHIHDSGAHLLTLIGSILDRAKIDAGRYELTPVLTAPGPIAETCAAMIRPQAERAGLSLHVEIAPGLPETMLDPQTVRQILINLLNNAVKFTADGSITLSVEEKCGALDFTVADTGIGMSQSALAKLGARFTDVHQSGVRGADGAGLGLSLCQSLARLHGGALRLTSAPGEGTTARFTVPLRRSLNQPNETGAPAPMADIQSQFDRVNAYRRERARERAA